MKKIITYSIFGFITLVSCKKEYTCDCVIGTEQAYYEDGVLTETPTTSSVNSTRKFTSKKKEAKTTCEGGNGVVVRNNDPSDGGNAKQTITTTCTLK